MDSANRKKRRLIMVSFDAVTSAEAEEKLWQMPNFRAFAEKGTYVGGVSSVLMTHTYVVHSSVITGCLPQKHGIYDNVPFQPHEAHPVWNHWDRAVQAPTLYQQAEKAGLRCAGILWPVSAGARMRWNMPEVLPAPGQSQASASIKNGSLFYQLSAILRHGKLMKGISQPELDDFSAAVACDTIRRQKPDLLLLHFTDVDTHKHHCGVESEDVQAAFERLDQRLGLLMQAVKEAGTEEETGLLVFSDHGAFDVHTHINLNDALERMGLCRQGEKGVIERGYRACFWQSDGCAYMHVKDKSEEAELVSAVRSELKKIKGVARFLSEEEMKAAALNSFSLGVEAELGYYFYRYPLSDKAVHGYSPLHENYQTFYAAAGCGVRAGQRLCGGCVTDICAAAARMLNLEPWPMDGKAPEGMFE